MASVLLIKQTAIAQMQKAIFIDQRKTIQRMNIGQRVFINYGAGLNLDPNNLDSVLKNLKTKGIYADEKSEIQVHQEKNFVDISCFNCIVVGVKPGGLVMASYNGIEQQQE